MTPIRVTRIRRQQHRQHRTVPELEITTDSLITVTGLSVAIVGFVQAFRVMGVLNARSARKAAVGLGLVLLPLLTVVFGGWDPAVFIPAVFAGGPTGLAAVAMYDSFSSGSNYEVRARSD